MLHADVLNSWFKWIPASGNTLARYFPVVATQPCSAHFTTTKQTGETMALVNQQQISIHFSASPQSLLSSFFCQLVSFMGEAY